MRKFQKAIDVLKKSAVDRLPFVDSNHERHFGVGDIKSKDGALGITPNGHKVTYDSNKTHTGEWDAEDHEHAAGIHDRLMKHHHKKFTTYDNKALAPHHPEFNSPENKKNDELTDLHETLHDHHARSAELHEGLGHVISTAGQLAHQRSKNLVKYHYTKS